MQNSENVSVDMDEINKVDFFLLKGIVARTKQKKPSNRTKKRVGTFNLEQSFPYIKDYLKPSAGLKHQL